MGLASCSSAALRRTLSSGSFAAAATEAISCSVCGRN
eukprot:CAMPEP_0176275418 /NCGR_PEP_ID=MMETSP0121_2-20121125/47229_1 /TAXON_ID=160619 /ORGANISM="Kryptoperidinium foliaceum, Strain CCMP 1326" /LENGTH=36 /DNA_ID= /DNA_START= /DNA_END= /DNA_ORIENTATION=